MKITCKINILSAIIIYKDKTYPIDCSHIYWMFSILIMAITKHPEHALKNIRTLNKSNAYIIMKHLNAPKILLPQLRKVMGKIKHSFKKQSILIAIRKMGL